MSTAAQQAYFDRTHSDDLIAFLGTSPSPYHAVASAAERLEKAGFRKVSETEAWDAAPGGRYLVRGGALIAWYLPEGAGPETPFRVVGTHTDSPNLRVKPVPDTGSAGWRQVAVEIYGGVPLNTWLDRDLGLSGRLALKDGSARLVQLDEPLLRVPQLAIHLDRSVNDGMKLDRQRHLTPIWGLGPVDEGSLIAYVAERAGLAAEDVVGWDLMTHDIQPASYLGRDRELLAAPRLDNLLSVHAGTAALAAVASSEGAAALPYIPVLAAFDHEETGSESDTGAQSPLLGNVLDRTIHARGGTPEDRARALAGTVCLSSDMGHAVHPNYPERHEPGHHPVPNGGPILKVNVNNRYATDGVGRAVFAAACEKAGVPWQTFVSNNAVACGTTIGPITAARLGIKTVDCGIAALSMHSARELCGAEDPHLLASALKAFLEG
ncbi:aminopeptidase 2 [Streptomyces rubellomurinus subsp. indigoferus]|uniref:Probable M18 family aminopeptidase 2 n=1 Tax=Streptomyces rubellomurinus (strain ATCC 31215) TaxID=359131 RepID=A0A0F2TCF8_STRR3|nr:M18 family aminopeptidase [Streptomyces rubellomurinus]KJS55367.1 aminopeptidase 2 [Streptomyces rubellomurinus subsp. indigoferus]KJS60854.1 aminopeptidase 2 [Streptomyces rubellomurinus]